MGFGLGLNGFWGGVGVALVGLGGVWGGVWGVVWGEGVVVALCVFV